MQSQTSNLCLRMDIHLNWRDVSPYGARPTSRWQNHREVVMHIVAFETSTSKINLWWINKWKFKFAFKIWKCCLVLLAQGNWQVLGVSSGRPKTREGVGAWWAGDDKRAVLGWSRVDRVMIQWWCYMIQEKLKTVKPVWRIAAQVKTRLHNRAVRAYSGDRTKKLRIRNRRGKGRVPSSGYRDPFLCNVDLILSIPVHVEMEDVAAWHYDTKGLFTIRSAYKV